MSSRSDPGRLYNRRVTRHIDSLLPDRVLPDRDFTFEGRTILDRENNPGKPAGGTCEIKAYVGEDGQLAVLEKSELVSQGETVWACWNRIRRTHGVGGDDLAPFRYHVQTQILNRGTRKRDETTVSLAEFESMPVYGGREVQAALILAETLAVETAVAPEKRSDVCCSLHHLPSFPRLIDRNDVLRLNWRDVDALIGPDAEMIAANTTVQKVLDEERKEAAAKGVELLSDEGMDSDSRQSDRNRSRNRNSADSSSGSGADQHGRHGDGTGSLPEDMSPEEAEKKLREMAEEIYEMRTGGNSPDE